MNAADKNDAARRAYWREQLDAAAAMMDKAMQYPVQECLEPLVSLEKSAVDAGVPVLFSGSPITGALPRLFFLRKGLIADFLRIAEEMRRRGWTLRVEDGFRTREMQTLLARKPAIFDVVLKRVVWELEGRLPSPEFMFTRLTGMVATRPKIGTHMSGSAVDISVVDSRTGIEVDRGSPYLELSELTPMDSPFVSQEARNNRHTITAIFESHGFIRYPFEFWHYSKDDAFTGHLTGSARNARYGAVNWNPADGSVAPMQSPTESLHSIEEIRAEIERAIARSGLRPAAREGRPS